MAEQSAGFIGLGSMGVPMATNLLKNGVKLYIYNRSPEKAKELIAKGAVWVNSPGELFQKTNVLFSMVSDDEALKAITREENGLLEQAKPNTVHVSMSTVSPKLVHELNAQHQAKGVQFLSAPVFGRPDVAIAAKLWICVAGDSQAKARVLPLLYFMGQKVHDFGDTPERANAVKLSGNFLILSLVEALSEMFAFVEKHGVELDNMNSFLADSPFTCPVIKAYGQLVASKQFEPAGFKMGLGLKDINLLLRTANSIRVPMPLAGILHDRLLSGLANNRGDMDWSAISLSEFEDAGLLASK